MKMKDNKTPIVSGCLDLGIAKPDQYSTMVCKLVKEIEKNLNFVVLMEDRQPDFFLTYDKYDPDAFVMLNKHGPFQYYPNQSDLKSFVRAFNEKGVNVFYGFWIHENRWVYERHPELLLIDETGKRSHNNDFNSDFNPLSQLEKDSDYSINNGQQFVNYICRQYSKLSADFGFNGLFIGDGGMGFRRFGEEDDDDDDNNNYSKAVRYYDYSSSTIGQFVNSHYYRHHNSCMIFNNQSFATDVLLNDIQSNHLEQWVEWNCFRWTQFYKILAEYLHANKHQFAAYNCMNYGPERALIHGVDYRSIAHAGLDYLIFQTYDYAWSQYFRLHNKDILTNLRELLCTKAYIHDSNTKLLFTEETADSVEKWDCPLSHTLGEVFAYSSTRIFNHGDWDPAVDGAFIVWINDTPFDELGYLGSVLKSSMSCHASRKSMVWDDNNAKSLLNNLVHKIVVEKKKKEKEKDKNNNGANHIIRKEDLPAATDFKNI